MQFKDPETGAWRMARPRPGETLDAAFDRIEAAIDAGVALGSGRNDEARDMGALGKRYIDALKSKNRSEAYIINRECTVDLWVRRLKLSDGRMLGTVPVSDWTPEMTQEVIARARVTVSDCRVEDIGTMLAGMRKGRRSYHVE